MGYLATPDVIKALKREKEKRNLSIAQIEKMMADAGFPMGQTTLRRVFHKGSETHDSFRYELTIEPLWRVLVMQNKADNEESLQMRIEDLEALIEMKNDAIQQLRDRIEEIKKKQDNKCGECAKRQEQWREQIKLKDARIDRKDRQIDDLNAQIARHQEREDRLLNVILERIES